MNKYLILILCMIFSLSGLLKSIGGEKKIFTREALISDARQLSKTIEETHPDPYLNGGGKIAFHRRLHEVLKAIPGKGMTREAFFRLISEFVATIGDSHTLVRDPHILANTESGLPLNFKIIENKFFVTGVPDKKYRDLMGASLEEIENISLNTLVKRVSLLRGLENYYTKLFYISILLRSGKGIKSLIPEWGGKKIKILLELPDQKKQEIYFKVKNQASTFIAAQSKIVMPAVEKSDVVYSFLDKRKKTALLVIKNMMRYREGCESWFAAGSLHALDFTKAAYAHFYKKPAPADQEELLGALPSVTETLCKLIWEMQKYKTSNLIIDLRDNTGGNDNMASILIYFLYGNRAMQSIYNGYTIIKYSDLYFKTYRKNSLKKVNLDREFPFVTGDYDFTDEAAYHSIKRAKSNHPAEAGGKNALKLAQKMPTFYKIYKTTQYHKPVYKLKKVFVLVSPGTYSSGFSTLVDLMKAGAVSVGTPSAQAGNNFTDILLFNLKNTGIQCGVSHKMNLTFPADARKGNLLEPDYKLTYDKYRYYDFDPNAEILLALELLGEK